MDLFRYMSGWTTKIEGQTLSTSQLGSDYFAYTLREPVGVVGQIIPWNFPLLAGAIWTKDVGKAHRLARAMKAGTVWINCYNIFDAALPFGGYKESGWGREMGKEAVELYTEVKSVCVKV